MTTALSCGCSASATHSNEHDGLPAGHPSCPVHLCCQEVAAPDLTGRMATCYPGCKPRPSSQSLAFFRYRGAGSPDATEKCVCGYMECSHDPECMAKQARGRQTKWKNPTVIEQGKCSGFRPHGPHDTDLFYCGCRGWD